MAKEPKIRTEADRDREFAAWFTDLVGEEKLRRCIHCGVCSGSCPLADHMDEGPRRIMYLAREGFKDDVLSSNTIWLCTSCYACTVECPQQIPVTDVMYALKRRALEEGTYPRRHPTAVMAREFSTIVRRDGRMNEVRLFARLALKSGVLRYLGMAGMGMNVVRKRRFSLRRDTIRHRAELRKLLDTVEEHRAEVAS